jgi:hypothetical protein
MINDLFVWYTTALDAGEVDTIVGCFTEDGALESPVVGCARRAGGDSRIRRTLCPLLGTRLAVARDLLSGERHHAHRVKLEGI